ncbi:hypothetical protein MAR_032108 [Mya arenaria]|uniref:Uncharacterized protein n=1 Tax=Mya arenaria TaxID=6604 RepID=A0ABY7F8L5_MYAAR|nr:hypothetical protein MAR_032108 [Mya arenaria]
MSGIFSILAIFLAVITGVFAGDFCFTNEDGFQYCYGKCCDLGVFYLNWRYCCNGGSMSGGAMIGIVIACICVISLTSTAIYYFFFYLPNEKKRKTNPMQPSPYPATGVAMTSTSGHMFQTTPAYPNQENLYNSAAVSKDAPPAYVAPTQSRQVTRSSDPFATPYRDPLQAR